jgi:hypothetical protein
LASNFLNVAVSAASRSSVVRKEAVVARSLTRGPCQRRRVMDGARRLADRARAAPRRPRVPRTSLGSGSPPKTQGVRLMRGLTLTGSPWTWAAHNPNLYPPRKAKAQSSRYYASPASRLSSNPRATTSDGEISSRPRRSNSDGEISSRPRRSNVAAGKGGRLCAWCVLTTTRTGPPKGARLRRHVAVFQRVRVPSG